ncbi:hypothetical protein CKAH01_13794 [Colletotrichum kahawae]|uniref:Uncharacterized protein n=1 Tax=Colletotrichum kahawae TaxID=34407 RepID=A0AAE0DB50_COLKA|nr:hypothetical protein CKAH01_13794 [Colletotrichum kahawae]
MVPIPCDLPTWRAQVIHHGVGNKTLTEIKRTSGSKIPHSAFLQLRAVWLPDKLAAEAIEALRDTGLIGDFTHTIRNIVARRPGEANTFHNFLVDIGGSRDDDRDPKTPASQSSESLVNPFAVQSRFGSFVVSVGQWRQLRPAAPNRVVTSRPPMSSTPVSDHIEKQSVPPLDYDKAPSRRASSRDLDLNVEDIVSLIGSMHIETPSKVPSRVKESKVDDENPSPTRSPRESPASASGAESEAEAIAQVVGLWASSSTTAREKLRTRYEVQTSNFFSGFFYAFFPHYLSFTWTEFLEVITEEASYRFGGTSSSPIFVARTDGAFYDFNNDGSRSRCFLPFELKPYCRDEKLDATCREETAEMAAIIYEEFVRDKPHPPSQEQEDLDETHHRFMLSLNREAFYITVATFTGHYISYISSTATRANSSDLGPQHLISFQPHGPFSLMNMAHMMIFREVMLSIALKKIESRGARGQVMLETLRRHRCDAGGVPQTS